MVLTLRKGPSGPPAIVSDTIVAPGELLGNPLGATTTEPAEPITGAEAGAIVRFAGFMGVTLPGGTYNDFEIPDGVQVLDITSTGGTVTITGFKFSGSRGNDGGFLTVSKSTAAGAVRFVDSNAGSAPENQILTPLGFDYELINSNETVDLQVFERTASPTKWQIVDRLLPGSGVASELGGFGVTITSTVTFAAGPGGAPDDVTILAVVPFQVRVLDVIMNVSTAVVGTTGIVRNQTGGAGAALSSGLSANATGTVRNNDTATRTTSLGLFLRRSDSGFAGSITVVMSRV